MADSPQTECERLAAADATLAKALAPEDIRRGDFVTPLYLVAEYPSFYWCCDAWTLPLDQPGEDPIHAFLGRRTAKGEVCMRAIRVDQDRKRGAAND